MQIPSQEIIDFFLPLRIIMSPQKKRLENGLKPKEKDEKT